MKNYRTFLLSLSAATLSISMLSACQPTATAPIAPVTADTTETAPVANVPTVATPPTDAVVTNVETAVKTPKSDNSCYVHLFDDDNFGDDNDIIYGPGKWANLKSLPDATESDWGDDADSLKVGGTATVKVWENENYGGKTQTFGPNTQKGKLDQEIRSMEISCQ